MKMNNCPNKREKRNFKRETRQKMHLNKNNGTFKKNNNFYNSSVLNFFQKFLFICSRIHAFSNDFLIHEKPSIVRGCFYGFWGNFLTS